MDTETLDAQTHTAPPEGFMRQVKQALEHLYDIEFLEAHALTRDTGPGPKTTPRIAGQRLRWELSTAIESLNPGAGTPFSAPPARVYNLLSLRYVERRSVQHAAQEMNLSRRQAHRDLRHGEENVATILWRRLADQPAQGPNAIRISSPEEELARLELQPRMTDVCDLLARARKAVEPMAAQRQIEMRVKTPRAPVTLSLDPVLAEQVLVNMLSTAIEQAQPDTLDVVLEDEEGQTVLTLRYYPAAAAGRAPGIDLVILRLADRLGWSVTHEDTLEGWRIVHVALAGGGPTVLVIDDNEGLVNLLKRYLTDQACQVISAANGQEGLRIVHEVAPDAIILDVMMPEMHGWEFLQRVRMQPRLANVPVIICSVINSPGLAESLGASVFLAKPVNRGDVLRALRDVGVMP